MRSREILRASRVRLMTSALAIPRHGTLRELFEMRYIPVTESGCWIWIGQDCSHGYGKLTHQGVTDYAHRISYILHKGDIPNGLVLDHLCRVRCCVNPEHIEVVTRGENVLRGESVAAKYKNRTHCKNGHALSGGNIITVRTRPGTRICRACKRIRDARRHQARRDQDAMQ